MWRRRRRLSLTSGECTLCMLLWPSMVRPWREWAAPSSWVYTSQRTSPGPTTLQHWPRKHNSVSTSSANSEEPEPRPPSCAPSTEAPSRAFWLAASLCVLHHNASCRKSLHRIVRAAEKIVGVSLPSLQDIYSTRLTRKALCIAGDPTHRTHSFFSLLPSGRRLRSLQARTNRLKDSFIHQAVRKLNSLPSLPPLPSPLLHHAPLNSDPPPPTHARTHARTHTHTHTHTHTRIHTHCDHHQSLCTALDWPHSTTSSDSLNKDCSLFVTLNWIDLISSLHYTIHILHCLFISLVCTLSTMCLMSLYLFFIIIIFIFIFFYMSLFVYL